MDDQNTIELKFKLNLLTDLWKEFCEKHTELYEYTCDEYMHLLSSDLDKLELVIDSKKNLIGEINKLEDRRQDVTKEVSNLLNIEKPKTLSVLIDSLKLNQEDASAMQIEKLNLVLLDIVNKIQEQNKKNQVFLNRALLSLKELKDSFGGRTNYKTYSSTGLAKSNLSY